nr:MAG TPA: hypothetical protein [Caudoviricetes sp.]
MLISTHQIKTPRNQTMKPKSTHSAFCYLLNL